MVTEFKSPFASKGVWGGGIAVIAGVLSFVGYTVSDVDQRSLADLIEGLIAIVGGILAIIGRIRATKRIG